MKCRVVSSSDNRGFAPISELLLDLLRLCSDFDVQQEKNRSMHCIPYFRAKILNFFAFFEKLQLRDAIKSNNQGGGRGRGLKLVFWEISIITFYCNSKLYFFNKCKKVQYFCPKIGYPMHAPIFYLLNIKIGA